jgi:hypothetical protein
VQHLARDAADVTELQVEVTWARAVTIMAEARSAWAERRAQESAISLAFLVGRLTRWLRRPPFLMVGLQLCARPGILPR